MAQDNHYAADTLSEVNSSELNEAPSNIIVALGCEEAALPSPIDININNAERIELPALSWDNYEKTSLKFKLINTGETVIIRARWAEGEHPSIRGGPLEGTYLFSQIHFHWGNSAVDGSEHTIDGASLPLEMHVVHFSTKFKDRKEAVKHVGGILVIVYFYNLKSDPNKYIAPVISNLKQITFPDAVIKITPFPILNLFHTFSSEYFTYWGSTKTVDSSHPVLWMISRTQECMDFHQLTQFRCLLDQQMRVIRREPKQVASQEGRHLFHVNPLTHYTNSTLSVLPHSKYINDRWVVDRMDIDIGAPGGCKELIEVIHREMRERNLQLDG
ncbi:carbonic anhydrase 1-like [Toxorhynchites rutilus septentrionalis]|uniref:carbonic anhydrase 1-like n=1 Tax=Toxorhynchites rutilus septentrionalis TaxID=329112 RepID=UPI00247999D7|nr:carbonic anhydrase 1-like [Toxorhynchites rutilus septentrionalis]